ncbi:MAG: capping complex subunit for YIEGIA [Dethiobacteria bacterium]
MEINKFILAIVTRERNKVGGCGTPIFYAASKEEQDTIATYLARITAGVVHDLENGVYIIVRH